MIDKTLRELEEKIRQSAAIPGGKQDELIALIGDLRAEVLELSKTKSEEAESIAGFTKLSGYEATRQQRNPQLLELSLKGLSSSVNEFEVSHPKLVERVNAICVQLAKLGI
jgi:hypothetical protein